jgi:hypothetical protein
MKYAIYTTIVVLAAVLAQGQKAPTATTKMDIPVPASEGGRALRVADMENQQLLAAALLRSYATCVNGLLHDLAFRLQTISQHAAAGQLTPEEAQRLKLAATRATIARLETISAVYDSQLVSNDNDEDSDDDEPAVLGAKSTVSVDELKREPAK